MNRLSIRKRAAGFSLIELMVAIAIGLALLALLATVFSNTSGSRTELDRVTRLMENARFGLDSVGDDFRHAGYYGALTPLVNTDYQDIDPCTNSVTPLTLGFDNASFPVKVPAPIQGFNDEGTGTHTCLANRVGGQDIVAIRRASATSIDMVLSASSVVATNLYIQASQCQTDTLVFKVSNDPALLDLRKVACAAGQFAPARRFFTRVYYLAACNVCSPSDGIPTLKRFEVVNGADTITALAEGVIGMQFEYGFDTDNDGEPNVFLTTPAPGSPAPEDGKWKNVVAVRAHLLVRSNEPSSVLSAAHTFDLGPGHTGMSCTAGYRCRLVSTTLRLNNVAGRRETP